MSPEKYALRLALAISTLTASAACSPKSSISSEDAIKTAVAESIHAQATEYALKTQLAPTPTPTFPLAISDQFGENFGPGATQAVQKSMDLYFNSYGCSQSTVKVEVVDFSNLVTPLPDGGQIIVDEQAGTGFANFSQALTENKLEKLINTAKHSWTHACKPSEPTYITPYILSDGSTVIGHHGLFLVTSDPENGKYFTKIEEGVAEALAVKLEPGYSTNNPYYFAAGSFTLYLLDNYFDGSPINLARFVQTNDVLGFISTITGHNSPSPEDISKFVEIYDLIFRGMPKEEAIASLEQYLQ